jgi:hypothetical protein
MADANFTLVSSSAWLTPGAARRWDAPTRMAAGLEALRAAEKAGLKVIFGLFSELNVQPWDNTTQYLNVSSLVNESSPALWGWLLADEPNPPDTMRSLARLKSRIDEMRPGHLSFVNLLPNYGNGPPWQSYEEYVDYFIETYKPQVRSLVTHCAVEARLALYQLSSRA